MPTISVIVPVYKVEPYLKKCVDSILNQTLKDFDLVLVDDGSPDNCGKMCDAYATQDERVHVIHQQNGGLSAARNAGIDWAMVNSPSQYVTFIDSDDWVDSTHLKTLLEGISLGVSISCTTFTRVYDSGDTDRGPQDTGWSLSTPEEYWCTPCCTQVAAVAKMFDKKILKDIRFPAGKIYEEVLTTHKIVFTQNLIAFRDYSSYYYLKRQGSITCSPSLEPEFKQIEAYNEQQAYLIAHGFNRAAEFARGRVYVFSIMLAKKIESTNPSKSCEMLEEVKFELTNKKLPFWDNRAIYRQLTPLKFLSLWPFAMLVNFIRKRKNSWLVREFVPMLRSIAIERRNR